MSTPEPKTVREIATEIILDCGRNADDVGTYVWVRVGSDLSKHEHEAWCSAIRSAIRTAVVTVEWPDEQQPADVVTAEQQQDGAARRVEAIRARYDTHGFRALSDGQIDELFGFLLGQLADLPAVTARVESAEGAWSAQQDIIEAERRRAEQALAELAAGVARIAELESEREADTRAVVRIKAADTIDFSEGAFEEWSAANGALYDRFADRIETLDATETEES